MCVYPAMQVFMRTYGAPIFDPVISLQNHPQASLKGGELNTQRATHSAAPSAHTQAQDFLQRTKWFTLKSLYLCVYL